MGRIKTVLVKRVSNELYAEHQQDFKPDFTENKRIVGQFADVPSKKLRNIIAGYVTRMKKKNKE